MAVQTIPRFVRSETVGARADLAALADDRGLKVGVEIGVDRGLFAVEFLNRWRRGEMLFCVDPWEPYPQMPWGRDGDLMTAAILLAPHARRVRIIRDRSVDVAPRLGLVDFVYLDGSHARADVDADLAAWWPQIRPGGFLAGHDFDAEHHEVQEAVIAFATANKLDPIWLTTDYNQPPSWFLNK